MLDSQPAARQSTAALQPFAKGVIDGKHYFPYINALLTMVRRSVAEDAEVLALEALAFLAASSDDIAAFLRVSGIDPAQLRALAGEPHLLGGVLDYVLANEKLLTRFCDAKGVTPASVHRQRALLSERPSGRSPE